MFLLSLLHNVGGEKEEEEEKDEVCVCAMQAKMMSATAHEPKNENMCHQQKKMIYNNIICLGKINLFTFLTGSPFV